MWIVMTSSASMPNSCWGRYRNVACVDLDQEYTAHNWLPYCISDRARGVLKVRHMGHHNVGKTDRCAYDKVVVEAERRCEVLNNATPDEALDDAMSWGGSA